MRRWKRLIVKIKALIQTSKNKKVDIYYWTNPHKNNTRRVVMAKRDGMLFNFFEKWKEKRLNKFAKKTLKDNPELEKSLKALDDEWGKIIKKLDKKK